MRKTLLALSVFCLTSLSAPTFAAEKYEFDTVHSQVMFFVDHLGFAKSEGEFLDFDGGFTLDRDDLSKSTIDVSIKTDSLDMDDATWDEHMKSPNFFNVAEYPEMTFKSTSIEVTGENAANITGDLTILGVTKPVVLKTVHNKSGENPYSKKFEAGFSATAHIKRSDFGMTYGLPGVGDDVEIRLEIEAVRVEEAAAE